MLQAIKDYYYYGVKPEIHQMDLNPKKIDHCKKNDTPLSRSPTTSPIKKDRLSSLLPISPIKQDSIIDIRGYKIIECIGRGNFGDVYKGSDSNNNIVAIKAINVEASEDDIPVLLQEINLLRSLKHMNITAWYETFIVDVTMYIVMEFCEFGSCSDLIKCNPKGVEEIYVGYIMKNALQGLNYLHNLKIIHRDIKSANILIAKNGIIKLADFGVSGQLIDDLGKKTFVGTPYWMAPEIVCDSKILFKDRENLETRLIQNRLNKTGMLYKLWKRKIEEIPVIIESSREEETSSCSTKNDEKEISESNEPEYEDVEYYEKVDIWSLGITMIELMTGSPPLNHKDPLKALFEIPKREPPTLPKESGYYAREFCVGCLVKDPTIRPSAEELSRFRFVNKNRIKNELFERYIYESKENFGLEKFEKICKKKKKPKFDLKKSHKNYGQYIQWDLRPMPGSVLGNRDSGKDKGNGSNTYITNDEKMKKDILKQIKKDKLKNSNIKEQAIGSSEINPVSPTDDLSSDGSNSSSTFANGRGVSEANTSPLAFSPEQRKSVLEIPVVREEIAKKKSEAASGAAKGPDGVTEVTGATGATGGDWEKAAAIKRFEGAVQEMERLGLFQ